MKYLIILADGAADEPIAELGNRTPLQAANKPNIDKLASMGRSGLLATIPYGFTPGSDIANLSVLGYDIAKVYQGRGPLEAASVGVAIADNEMVARCNLITIEDGKIKNHSAGHISSEEAYELIEFLESELGGNAMAVGEVKGNFFPGVSYRHLIKVQNGNKDIKCTPPHDVPGTPSASVMIEALTHDAKHTAEYLNRLILRSQELLPTHPVNIKRVAEGKDPANSVWFWSPGYRPRMETFKEKYGIDNGSVISAVDLIKGIGVLAGLKSIDVEGATGLYDTNYEGKAAAAIEALKHDDFVFLHIEASDEAGHEGDAQLKTKTIEYLDSRVVGPIMNEVAQWKEPVAIAILPDHPTPCAYKTHTTAPVPFIIYKPGVNPDGVAEYSEESALRGDYGILHGSQFIEELLK